MNIGSSAENTFVKANAGLDALIGASDSVEGTWRWADTNVQFWSGNSSGSAVGSAYANWDLPLNQPDNFLNQDCGLISAISGKWFDVSCSTAYYYVCEEDLCPTDIAKVIPGQCGCEIADTDTDGDGTADCIDGCPADPDRQSTPCSPDTDCTLIGNGSIDYFFCSNLRSYSAAKAKCEAVGFKLARIDTQAENTFIDQQISTDRWIGGSDSTSEDAWVWEIGSTQFWQGAANGNAVNGAYSNWSSGQPNNLGDQDCLQILGSGAWIDDSCSNTEQYVCEEVPQSAGADGTFTPPSFPAGEIGDLLRDHFALIGEAGPNAQADYEASLDALRDEAADVTDALMEAYDAAPDEAFAWRYALVQTLSALQSNATLDALEEIALTPASDTNPPTSEHITRTSNDLQLIIYGRAADGIATLAKNGNSTADAFLLQCAEECSLLARMYSVTGYLATGNRAARVVALKAVLPDNQHYLTLPIEDEVPILEPPTGVPNSEIPPIEEPD